MRNMVSKNLLSTSSPLRCAFSACRLLLCASLLLLSGSLSAESITPTEFEASLQSAFTHRIGDKAIFEQHLLVLNDYTGELTAHQRHAITYLNGIKNYRDGEIATAARLYQGLIDQQESLEMQFRALVSLTNLHSLRGNPELAFRAAVKIMDPKYQVLDDALKQHATVVLSYLFLKAGLLSEAEEMFSQVDVGPGSEEYCFAQGNKVQMDYHKGELLADPDAYADARSHCRKSQHQILALLMDAYVARNLIELDDPEPARQLLEAGTAEVDAIGYSNLTAVWYSLLSILAAERGETKRAIAQGEIALQHSIAGSYSDADIMANKALADAYYQAEDYMRMRYYLQQYHDAYVSKVDELRTAAIAYYSVKLHIDQKQQQLDKLDEQLATLELQKQLSEVELQNRGLYLALLVALLLIGLGWAYRIRRDKRSLTKLVQFDALTGVYSRRHAAKVMERTLGLYQSMGQDVGFILVDLDNFKQINDDFGHQVGDWALKQAAQALQSTSRRGDIVCRLGGEEFGILLQGCDLDSTRQVAEKCRRALNQIETSEAGGFAISGSFGVSTASRADYQFNKLFSLADKAMYQAKRRGRDQVVSSEEELA